MISFNTMVTEETARIIGKVDGLDGIYSSYLNKYRIPRKLSFSGEFFQRTELRKLSEPLFKYIYDYIIANKKDWSALARFEKQRYLFYSTSRERAVIVNYIVSEDKMVFWTTFPKGRHKSDNYPDTIKIIFENKENCDIIFIEID